MIAAMPEGCNLTGMIAERPGVPSSRVTATMAMCRRRPRVNAVCLIRVAADANAYGPGGHRRATRASSLANCAADNTLGTDRPPIAASSHGTITCRGGRPSTDSEISDGAAFASRAVIAVTADRSASAAVPNSRVRAMPASLTPRSISPPCADPAHKKGATWFRPVTRCNNAKPASSCQSPPG